VTGTPSAPSKEQVLEQARRDNVKYVSFQFTDILGVVKNVTIPFHQFEGAVDHGLWFDGSSIEGFTRIHESDMYLQPDLSTWGIIPWERGDDTTARVICDVFTPEGEPFDGDPRYILRRQLERTTAKGWRFNTGPELEFFLLEGNPGDRLASVPHDKAGYFDSTSDEAVDIRKRMVNALEELGIEVEALHHEVAIGQHEIDFRYADALKTADNAVTLRVALKAVAQRTLVNGHPLYATFMPKPFFGINGSGMHTHQSLADLKTGKNLFYDGSNEYNLSLLARQFIAGLLKHARGLSLVLSPLVNSYKRLVPGYEAPVYICRARFNRSALIRIPQASRGRPEATRAELRCPDPSCNPYLAFAAMLAAGLDGIESGLEPPDPVEENLYHFTEEMMQKRGITTLPGSLAEALDAFEQDSVVRGALGEHVTEWLLEGKRQEWDEYRKQVSRWELERYLETY